MSKRRKEVAEVKRAVEDLGVEEAFDLYDFEEVESPTFHKLRKAYLKAKERLLNYVDNHS